MIKYKATPTNVRVNGVKRKNSNPTNWQFSKLKSCMSAVKETLPSSVSLKSKFPPVYTQIYGSCTANTVVACDAYYYHTNEWHPSATFTYYNSIKDDKPLTDDGSTVENALDSVRHFGVCNATVWPNEKPFNKKPSKKAYADGLKGHEVTKYYNVKTLLQIKKALSLGYPIAVVVEWCFKNYDQNYILNTPTKKEIEDCESCHAMVIVGYDDKTKLFEVRNSWGPKWGNNGYAYITYDVMKKIIIFNDSYAVVK